MSRRVATAAKRTARLTDFCDDDSTVEADTCPNGDEWCDGPDGDDLPCFACFDPDKDYNVGGPE
jgi:hypothetical protein